MNDLLKNTYLTEPSLSSCLVRFEAKFVRDNVSQCWKWIASTFTNGYGQFNVEGRNQKAHRISYRLYRGRIPKGLSVLHKCDNKVCVNPYHLFLGSGLDNMRDMIAKGRDVKVAGEEHPGATITEEDVKQIRLLYETGQKKQADLCRMFNLSRPQICGIVHYRYWRKVSASNS